MNKVFLAGRLASDPQQFVTQNGITQSRVSIACADNWNKNEAYFFPCVAWQSTANFINTYLKKGDAVVVDGKLIRRSYVSKEGKTVYVMEVVIETIRPFGSRKNTEVNDVNSIPQNNFNANQQTYSTPKVEVNTSPSDQEIEDLLKEFETTHYNVENNSSSNNSSDDEDDVVDLDWMKEI